MVKQSKNQEKQGYMSTGGGMMNLGGYHLQDTFVKIKIEAYTDRHMLILCVKDAKGFQKVHDYLQQKKVRFSVNINSCDLDLFEVRFVLGVHIKASKVAEFFARWAEKIHDKKTMYPLHRF